MRTLLTALVAIAATAAPAGATTIDPLTWEQLVIDADFVGIVECTTAGGVVAKYEVVETWKGEKKGATISVRVAPNYWGPQYPIALVGERYFVTAYQSPPSTMASTTLGGPVPLWWRDLPADYTLPLFQGRVALPLSGGDYALAAIGTREHDDLDALEKDARALLKLSDAEQELTLYRALAKKYFTSRGYERKGSARAKKVYAKIARAKKVKDAVELLLDLARDDSLRDDWGWAARTILRQAGRAETLAILDPMGAASFPSGPSDYQWIVEAIELRLGKRKPKPYTPPATTAPAPLEMAKMRKILDGSPTDEQFYQVFEPMTAHDPARVAAYLKDWVSPDKHWSDAERGYALGSYFGARCGGDCETHLKTLLGAKDEYIRVAAAVYLSFTDEKTGVAALRKLCRLDGDPGAWAALALARRGVKGAMPRLMKVFAVADAGGSMKTVNHGNLQKRALVLMSNSAAKSGVPQPERNRDGDYYAGWYKKHRGQLEVGDPWLPALIAKKID